MLCQLSLLRLCPFIQELHLRALPGLHRVGVASAVAGSPQLQASVVELQPEGFSKPKKKKGRQLRTQESSSDEDNSAAERQGPKTKRTGKHGASMSCGAVLEWCAAGVGKRSDGAQQETRSL